MSADSLIALINIATFTVVADTVMLIPDEMADSEFIHGVTLGVVLVILFVVSFRGRP